jgi:hypothetical protein
MGLRPTYMDETHLESMSSTEEAVIRQEPRFGICQPWMNALAMHRKQPELQSVRATRNKVTLPRSVKNTA